MLRLIEDHGLSKVAQAVNKGLRVGAHTRDAIAQFLIPQPPWRPPTFRLDGREHLRLVKVARPDISAYQDLLSRGGSRMSEKNKPTVLLEHYLKKLKLPTMLREYASMAAVCRDDRSDYPTYLLRLTERELLDRERKAAERRVKEARFPVTKTIDTFDFKAQPSINEPLVRELMRGEFIDKRENVLLIGNSGTGKTHLACALAFCACMQGRRVRFYTVTGLVTELLE